MYGMLRCHTPHEIDICSECIPTAYHLEHHLINKQNASPGLISKMNIEHLN